MRDGRAPVCSRWARATGRGRLLGATLGRVTPGELLIIGLAHESVVIDVLPSPRAARIDVIVLPRC